MRKSGRKVQFRWPLVSRRAFDLVLEERDRLVEEVARQADRLVEQADKFFAHMKRIDRIEHGVGEVEREPRKKLEPMPVVVKDYLDAIDNPSMQRFIRNELLRRNAQGEDWASIQKKVMEQGKEEEPANATVGT